MDQNSRRYPCLECEGTWLYCSGEKIAHHWKHINRGLCTSSPESWQHKLAKELIKFYLNIGGYMEIRTLCDGCSTPTLTIVPVGGIKWEQEVPYKSSKFDIGGLKDGLLVYCIEIFYKHETTNCVDRNDMPWVELDALEVIDLLYKDGISHVTFQNKKACVCEKCQECQDNKLSAEERLKIAENLKSFYEEKAMEHNLSDEESNRIAVKLDLCFEDNAYACDARKIVDIAMMGRYIKTPIRWNTFIDLNDSQSRILAGKLVKDSKCVRCRKKCPNISFGKFFCITCYKQIKKEEDKEMEEEWISVDDSVKFSYRKELRWLDMVPETPSVKGSNYTGDCYICKCPYNNYDKPKHAIFQYWEPGTNNRKISTWWFGSNKHICTMCLEREMIKRGILDHNGKSEFVG